MRRKPAVGTRSRDDDLRNSHWSQEKSSLEAAIFRKLLCDSPPGGMIFLRRNINTLPHGFPSLSEIFQLVRALRQVSPDGDSFTPSDWPVTGPLAGPLTVSWLEFRSVEGLHPPGIFNSNEKRIRPSAAVRKRIHFGDWPVYWRVSSTIDLLPVLPTSMTPNGQNTRTR